MREVLTRDRRYAVADDRPSAIVAITAGVNPVTGVDSYVIEYSDGETQSHDGPWCEARELADRVGLDPPRGRHPLDPLGANAD